MKDKLIAVVPKGMELSYVLDEDNIIGDEVPNEEIEIEIKFER